MISNKELQNHVEQIHKRENMDQCMNAHQYWWAFMNSKKVYHWLCGCEGIAKGIQLHLLLDQGGKTVNSTAQVGVAALDKDVVGTTKIV